LVKYIDSCGKSNIASNREKNPYSINDSFILNLFAASVEPSVFVFQDKDTMQKNNSSSKSGQVAFRPDQELLEAYRAAKEAGGKYNGRSFSDPLAYEIGVKVLLGLGIEDEEAIRQEMEQIKISMSALQMKYDILQARADTIRAQREATEQKQVKACNDVQKLAECIISNWASVKLFRKSEPISQIVVEFEGKVKKPALEAVFKNGGTEAPTLEEALKIASELMQEA